jgi:hypothetical protein
LDLEEQERTASTRTQAVALIECERDLRFDHQDRTKASRSFDRLSPRVLHVFHLRSLYRQSRRLVGASERTQNNRKERKRNEYHKCEFVVQVFQSSQSLQSVRDESVNVHRTGWTPWLTKGTLYQGTLLELQVKH